MRLRGIDFGRVLDASGVRGFFGEGYPYHRLWRPFGLDLSNSTFVAKTTTLLPRVGNMPLNADLSPREWKPRCVVVKPFAGVTLNAVGLSGPGAEALLSDGRWQKRETPFFLSFMSVETTATRRLQELVEFVEMLRPELPRFAAPVGLQINLSCPNVKLATDDGASEARAALDVASMLDIPLMPKFNALLSHEMANVVSDHPACDALCISNTIPWGARPDLIEWADLFGSEESPLAEFGGGGLSGAPLHKLVWDWLIGAERFGITKPINAGGGILTPENATDLLDVGASSVFIGSMTMLRPWRVGATVRTANAHPLQQTH